MRPILITGVPRSGTSLCAGLIQMAGIHFGSTIPGNKNNRKGFFEHAGIRNQIIKPFLMGMGRDPMGQKPLPDPGLMARTIIPDLRSKIEGCLGVAKGERWALKEPKLLLMWKPFHVAFPEARWVIVRREDEDILDSIQRTPFMRAYSRREDWRGWLEYHLQRIEELKKEVEWTQFWPQKAIDGDFHMIHRLEEFLGIRIPFKKAQRFIDPSLWHEKGSYRPCEPS